MTALMKYYEIYDDVYIPGRWNLSMPLFADGEDEGGCEGDDERELFDVWRFKEGRVLKVERPIRLSMKPAGIAIEYSESMGIPVVHRRVVSLFERLGLQKEVQFIPVEVEGQTGPGSSSMSYKSSGASTMPGVTRCFIGNPRMVSQTGWVSTRTCEG